VSALILYLAVAAAIVLAWHRFIRPIGTAAMIAMIAMPLCFTGRAMFTGRVYAPVDLPFVSAPLKDYAPDYGIAPHNAALLDVFEEMIPWRFAAREAITRGRWPLLNQHQLCGSPLAGAVQSAPYDPFRLIVMLIPFAASLTFGAAITLFLAGFFTFAFARELGCSEEASLIGAAAFMFCGAMAFFLEWMQGAAFAFLPLVMVAVRRGTFLLLTIALVLTVFAGHPESLCFIVTTGIAYGLVSGRRIGIPLAAGVFALLITAIQLLPFFAVLPEMYEPGLRRDHPRVSADAKQIAIHAGSMFLPFYGREQTALWDVQPGRVGAIAFALAATAVGRRRPRRRETIFFATLAVVTTLIGWDAPPLADLLRKLPLFDLAINNRFIFVACFAFAILAAIGADAARERPSIFAAIAVALIIALAIATRHTWPAQVAAGVRAPMIKTMLLADLLPLACAALLLALRVPRATILILGLVLVQRTMEDGAIYPSVDRRAFYPRVPILAAIPHSDEPFRVVGLGDAFPPDTAAIYGLEDPRGYEAITSKLLVETYPHWCTPWRLAYNRVDDLSRPFLSLMNVRYAIATADTKPPDGWSVAMRDRNTVLLENLRAKPRAFIENGAGTLRTRHAPNGLVIDADIQQASSVVVSQVALNGWRATLDDHSLPLARAHHAFLQLNVPAGRHRVRLTYMPRAFVIGRAISLAALLLLALILLRRR